MRLPRPRTRHWLAIILLLGLSLRLHCLGCESLWLDEGYSLNWALSGPLEFLFNSAWDPQTPLYFLILKAWIAVFGTSDLAIRLLSAMFGTLSIYFIFRLSRTLFDDRTALLSSFLMALSTYHLFYSQEARPYSLMILLTILSTLYFVELRKRSTERNELLYVAFSTLLIYTHIFGILTVLAQNAFTFLQSLSSRKPSPDMRAWLRLQRRLSILAIPWMLFILVQLGSLLLGNRVIGWIPPPSPQLLLASFIEYSGYYNYLAWGSPTFELTQMISLVLFSLLASLAIFSVLRFGKGSPSIRFTDSSEKRFLIVWLMMVVLLPYLISLFSIHVFFVRYIMAASLPFYILAAQGIAKTRYRPIMITIAAIIAALALMNASIYFSEPTKEQWREVASHIDSKAEEGDLLLFHVEYAMRGPINHYLEKENLTKEPFPRSGYDFDEGDLATVEQFAENYDRIWLILYQSRDPEGMIEDALERTHEILDQQRFVGIKLILYSRQQ